MDLSRQEYPAMLDTLDPPTAVNVLNDRVKHVGKVNTEIADWLAERRRIEEVYVSNLRKLAQMQPPNDASELGVFTTPWQKIISSAVRLADSHQALASRMDSNVEKPLRSYASSNREMQAMSTMQGNLQSLARDYESAQKKADKLNQRGDRAEQSRVTTTSSDFDNASSQWTSQAPYVFEALQAVDESRCNFLRDVLTQYETLEVELVEKNQKTAENVLNSLLSIETANEIRTFASRTSGTAPRRASAARRMSRIPPRDNLPVPAPAPAGEEISHQQSPTAPVDKKSRFGGLKRLGTVVSRRKSALPPQVGKGGSSSALGDVGFGSSTRSTGSRLRPTREDSEASVPPSSPPPNMSSTSGLNGDRPRVTRDLSESSLGDVAPPPGPPPSQRPQELESNPMSSDLAGINMFSQPSAPVNGTSQGSPTTYQTSRQPQAPTNGIAPQTSTRDVEGFSVPPTATDPISQLQAEAEGDMPGSQSKVLLRDEPIAEDKAQSEAAMATMANRLREEVAPPRRSATTRGRRDVRSAIFAPSQMPLAPPDDEATRSKSQQRQPGTGSTLASPIAEFPPQGPAQLQMQPMVAPSFASAPDSRSQETAVLSSPGTSQSRELSSSSPSGSQSTAPAIFATPFVSSLYSGQGQSMFSSSSTAPRPSLTEEPSTTSDTQSIRSARSAGASTTGGTVRHPDLRGPGLSSSVIETVSAWFEKGVLTRATLIGEVALAYNADVSQPGSFVPETIRLDNFSLLEKVAPNPAFITATTSAGTDKAGEYSVDVTAIPRANVAFKYQVHLDSTSTMAAQAVLHLTPTWRVEATQASVILGYGANATLATPVTLQNVVIAITVEGASARSCLSKPSGTFSKDRGMIYWRFEEVVLNPGAAPQKLLARFATDGEAKPGRVEARWEVLGGSGSLGSGLGLSRLEAEGTDPFADSDETAGAAGGTWKEVDVVRKVASGTYVAI